MNFDPKYSSKILWLASYPKSGNTWLRAFLTALLNGGQVDINSLKTDGIFSSRFKFDLVTEIESTDLYEEEAKCMVADVQRYLGNCGDKLRIIKIHDAFLKDSMGENQIPEDVTQAAIYLIRNPLDIAGSLANHNHSTLQAAVDMLNDKKGALAKQNNNLNINPQFSQLLCDWSGHVNSWVSLPSFPVYVMRYEDMLNNGFETFQKVVQFIGWDYSPEQIKVAIAATSFSNLNEQEIKNGFNEKSKKAANFFRSGTTGNWQKELTPEQINEIISKHGAIMKRYNYLDAKSRINKN